MPRLTLALTVLALAACGRPPVDTAEGASFEVKGAWRPDWNNYFGAAPSEAMGVSGAAAPSADASGGAGLATTGTGTVPAGVLTAGQWDDNLNFDRFLAYRDALSSTGKPPWSDAEQRAAQANAAQSHGAKTALDVVLVIDTTGSMGDEIRYLQGEFTDISQLINDRYPGVRQRWALVAYKDYYDTYVLHGADFGTSVTWFQGQLAQLEASGGDDFPEVPDQGLQKASELSWDLSADTARLVFWVADAPHHDDKAAGLAHAVRLLRDEGVHVYPVASSGIDELTEYTMRGTAQLTHGRYTFLTDDSGVGGEHKTPSVPCFAVTHLNQAIVRAADLELSGAYTPPDPATVVRTEGNPVNGVCTLDDGSTATLF